ncbi:hypothetical protein San01_72120 [Streptomyces angustmyceticus]|uniref:Uncharacterized protein n=1 Tax=Streptomyces angustmyceticus TaxID=285578 RepID=A0A5J4LQC6_9ACTN|nr:hypothetical protein San01_72120 [Streptomyces angustmyceticus]
MLSSRLPPVSVTAGFEAEAVGGDAQTGSRPLVGAGSQVVVEVEGDLAPWACAGTSVAQQGQEGRLWRCWSCASFTPPQGSGQWFSRCVGPTLLSVRGSPCKGLLGPHHGERYSAMMTGVRCALSDAQLTCEYRICIAGMILHRAMAERGPHEIKAAERHVCMCW